MGSTGLGAVLVVVGTVSFCLAAYQARAEVDFLRGVWRLNISDGAARWIRRSYYAFAVALIVAGIILILLARMGAIDDRPSPENGPGRSNPVVVAALATLMAVMFVVSSLLFIRSWRHGGPPPPLLGEKPTSVAQFLRGDPAAALVPPGLAPENEDETAIDGTVMLSRSYRYLGSSQPGGVLGFYRHAMPPLGWALESNDAAEHDSYFKTLDGRTVHFVVAADERGASTRIWTTYYQGLTLR